MRAAIYTRYSTDRQGDTSIEGQVAVCREFAAREKWPVVGIFDDRAMSGADPRRPGYGALLEAGRAGDYDVILVEEVSRLWRSLGEQWRCVEELEMLGLHVVGIRDGIDTRRDGFELLLAVQGAMNARARREAGWRTHRGLSVVVDRGMFAGGIPYGYRSVAVDGGHHLEVVEAQAQQVLWVFEQYTRGWSPQRIAHELNASGVKSARGGTWAVSAIYGHARYQTGLLRNPIYIGRYIWNRSQWIKDLRTGIRKRKERPESQWRETAMPHLRIVPDDLWQAAQARRRSPHTKPGKPTSTPLSGLLKCGGCGGAVVAIDAYSYGCAARKDRGPTVCEGVAVNRKKMESWLFEMVREELLSDEAVREFRLELVRLAREEKNSERTAEAGKRLAALDAEIAKLVDAVAAMGLSAALASRLKAAEAERDALQQALRKTDSVTSIAMIPQLVASYKTMLGDLQTTLAVDPEASRNALRDLVGDVRLVRDGGEIYAEVLKYQGLLIMVAGARCSNSRYTVIRRKVT